MRDHKRTDGRRTVSIYHLNASDADFWDASWDYESDGKGPGWYWDSWIDGKPVVEMDGPFSTAKVAAFAAGVTL